MKGGTNERTDGRTDEQKSPCVLQDFVPFGAAAQKLSKAKDIRYGIIYMKSISKYSVLKVQQKTSTCSPTFIETDRAFNAA